jgi:acyl carrier protein
MDNQDFLKLLNAVVKVAKPFHDEAPNITDMELKFSETTIDSLDRLMVTVYMTEIFGVDEEKTKELKVNTPQELKDFLEANKTKEVTDVDSIIAGLK